MLKKILIFNFLILNLIFSNLPISRSASLIDSTSSREVLIEATGIYESKNFIFKKNDVKKNGITQASLDAKKAAVFFVLFNAVDPLIDNEKSKASFNRIQNSIFDENKILTWITYADTQPKKVIKFKKGESIKVVLDVKVNRETLKRFLEDEGILTKRSDLITTLGFPQIIIKPESEEKSTNKNQMKHLQTVIESTLTNRGYDVIKSTQKNKLDTYAQNQAFLKIGKSNFEIEALNLGADIYIEFNLINSKGAYDTIKKAVQLKAYETSTARLLAAETGYSKSRLNDELASIEEASQEAINSILSRINSYWNNDLSKGLRHQLIFIYDEQINHTQQFNVQDSIGRVLSQLTEISKEDNSNNASFSYIVWVDPKKVSSSRLLYKKIKETLSNNDEKIELTPIIINKKLVIISLRVQD